MDRLKTTFIASLAIFIFGCAAPRVPADAVPVNQIQIQSRFDSVEVTQSTLGIELHECLRMMPPDSPVIRERQSRFPYKGSWATSHLGTSKTYIVQNTTAICLHRSEANFPIYAAEVFYDTVNPEGVPEEVLDVWYKKIALLIAIQGKAVIAYEAPNGNAFIATYWVEPPQFGLFYSNEFKKAGDWESGGIDAHFQHANLLRVNVVNRSGRSEKMNLLSHRNNMK